MDPRHPELAIDRMVELMTQFNLILKDMKHTTVSAKLGQLEREGGLVVQEICLVAPRLHEAMMQTSRSRRHELAHVGADMAKTVEYLKQAEYVDEPHFEISEKAAKELLETYTEPNQAETVIVEPKPRKKTSKKKSKK